jgi:hypothetical protein
VLLSTDYFIPYELMHDGKSFLATKIDFYRSPIIEDAKSLAISEKAQNEAGYLAIVTNPTGDLAAAEREAAQILDFFKAKEDMNLTIDVYSQKGASYRALSKIFSSPRLDIFHYSGHSGATSEDIYFHLPDDPFSVIDLYLQYPALFFLNMCESDIRVRQKVRYQGTETLNFPMALMRRGAKGCLATLWPIVDASAAQFAIAFYKQLLKGEPFGTSIRKTKEHLANTSDPNDLTWASFIMYGSPGFSTVKIPKKDVPAKEKPKGIAVYLSYSQQDSKDFHISEVTRSLELNPMVHKVFDHVRDFTQNIPAYMNENIPQSDVVLVFCSKNSQRSRTMVEELNATMRYQIEIIPVYIDKQTIPISLKIKRGLEFDPKNIQATLQQLRLRINMVTPRRT